MPPRARPIQNWRITMHAPDQHHEMPETDLSDPIGAPELPKLPRYLVRALALSGIAISAPLATLIANTNTGTTTPCC
jgi:hypothetical protein